MLYTFSSAHYDCEEFEALLAQLTTDDALIFWQDGVLQAVRSEAKLATIQNVFVLQNDLIARGLTLKLSTISLEQFVQLSEHYFPQVAL
ncbi:MAG: sulfurtransferase complex subunit TusB [Pasteurellaceae bacterium]|nr:sulfurtransferase complex subunit TusB [Pasteurellaceae bacterium]